MSDINKVIIGGRVVSLKGKASEIAEDLERVRDRLKQHETEMKNGGKNGK